MSRQLRKFRMICKHGNTKQKDVKNALNLILVRKVYNAQWETALGMGGHQLERPFQALKLIIIAY